MSLECLPSVGQNFCGEARRLTFYQQNFIGISARRGGSHFRSETKVAGKVRPSGRDTRPKGIPHP